MGIFDWLIILFLVFVLWRGWRKGFIGMLLHLIGIILVFFLIAHYFPLVKHGIILKLHLGVFVSTILAVVLIVALIAIIVQIIRMLLEKAVKLMHMSFINSAMGALFGFMAGLIFLVVLSIMIELIPSVERSLRNSDKHRVYAAVKIIRSELDNVLQRKVKLPAVVDSLAVKIPKLKK